MKTEQETKLINGLPKEVISDIHDYVFDYCINCDITKPIEYHSEKLFVKLDEIYNEYPNRGLILFTAGQLFWFTMEQIESNPLFKMYKTFKDLNDLYNK